MYDVVMFYNIMTAQFTEVSYLHLVMTYYGYSKVINWSNHYKLYTKLTVNHSSFHIWFGFSCTPIIKVTTCVFTQAPRLNHKNNNTTERKCSSAKHWPRCLRVQTAVITLIFGVQENPNQIWKVEWVTINLVYSL